MTEQTTHYNGDLDTDVSLEVWELTLPEDEAKCLSPQGCQAGAEWRNVASCCGITGLHCTRHKDLWEATYRWQVDSGHARCADCDGLMLSVRWHRI